MEPILKVNHIYVQRDYQEGTVCKFSTNFPKELEDRIERNVYINTINTLNEMYKEADKCNCETFLEGLLGCMTAYLSYLCVDTRCEKYLKKIRSYIQEQNYSVYMPRGLYLTDPLEKGLRVLEISIYSLTYPEQSNNDMQNGDEKTNYNKNINNYNNTLNDVNSKENLTSIH